jgi:hypothetical protein
MTTKTTMLSMNGKNSANPVVCFYFHSRIGTAKPSLCIWDRYYAVMRLTGEHEATSLFPVGERMLDGIGKSYMVTKT